MNQPSEEEVGLSSIGELINFLGDWLLFRARKEESDACIILLQ